MNWPDVVNLGKSQITDIMRRLNELEKEMDSYVIPVPESEQEHVITLNNQDLEKLSEVGDSRTLHTDKYIENALKLLIHNEKQ